VNSIWDGVDRLLDAAEDEHAIAVHSLQFLAIRRWRETGRAVPATWLDDQRLMAMVTLALPGVLRQIRSVVEGPIVLMKGPEVATLYPGTALRPFGDVDLLVQDADVAHQALLELGLSLDRERPAPDAFHHLTPLRVEYPPLKIEIHRRPNWLPWLPPPSVEELFAAAGPSRLGVVGLSTLAPEHHALTVAVHNWLHGPLLSVGGLLDSALLSRECDPAVLLRTAKRWGVDRIWQTSSRAAEALLLGEGSSLPLAIGGRHLRRVHERTMVGWQASMYLGSLWAPTPMEAVHALSTTLVDGIRLPEGHSWRTRAPRIFRVVRSAARPASRYDDLVK